MVGNQDEVQVLPRRVSLRDLRAVYDPEMHTAMLRDAPRHRFYAACLKNHSAETEGKSIVDVGAGSGVLAALAVRYGNAGEVHAVEALPEVCRLIPDVLDAALSNEERRDVKVTVHNGLIQDICQCPPQGWPTQVAALVSEWLGVMALNEGMALPVLRCRDSFSPAPRMIPGRVQIWVQAAASRPEGAVSGRCGPLLVPASALLGQPVLLLDADLQRCSPMDLFQASPSIVALPGEPGEAAAPAAIGLAGWFDLVCCSEHASTVLPTGPDAPETHWVQSWMPFNQPVAAPAELQVRLRIANNRNASAGLPELAVEVDIVASGSAGPGSTGPAHARFLLDSGQCQYSERCDTGPPWKRPRCETDHAPLDSERCDTGPPWKRPGCETDHAPLDREKELSGENSTRSDAQAVDGEDVEVRFFASDIAELCSLAKRAVAEGPIGFG